MINSAVRTASADTGQRAIDDKDRCRGVVAFERGMGAVGEVSACS